MIRSSSLLLIACIQIGLFAQSNSQDTASLYFNNYQFKKTIEFLEQKKAKNIQDYYLLAKSNQQLGRFEQVEPYYLKGLEMDPSNSKLLNNLASFYKQNTDYQKASTIYTKLIEIDSTNAYYHKKLGQLYQRQNDVIKAIIKFQDATKLDTSDVESSQALIELLIKIDQKNTADSLLNNQLTLLPTNKPFLRLATKLAYSQKDFKKLNAQAEKLFELGDSSLLIQKLSGIAHYRLKNYNQAIVLLSNVLQVDKKSEIINYYLGLAYWEAGELAKSTIYLEKAIDFGISNNIDNYYTQLATVYEAQKDHNKAIQAYKIAYKNSKSKILLYHLARNYDAFYKDKSVALTYYQRYLDQNDTQNVYYSNYSKYRVQELKVAKHFELDTIN